MSILLSSEIIEVLEKSLDILHINNGKNDTDIFNNWFDQRVSEDQ